MDYWSLTSAAPHARIATVQVFDPARDGFAQEAGLLGTEHGCGQPESQCQEREPAKRPDHEVNPSSTGVTSALA